MPLGWPLKNGRTKRFLLTAACTYLASQESPSLVRHTLNKVGERRSSKSRNPTETLRIDLSLASVATASLHHQKNAESCPSEDPCEIPVLENLHWDMYKPVITDGISHSTCLLVCETSGLLSFGCLPCQSSTQVVDFHCNNGLQAIIFYLQKQLLYCENKPETSTIVLQHSQPFCPKSCCCPSLLQHQPLAQGYTEVDESEHAEPREILWPMHKISWCEKNMNCLVVSRHPKHVCQETIIKPPLNHY